MREPISVAMVQDRLVEPKSLVPSQLDRGLFFGDGVYEVLRSYRGRIFALGEHLERFARSLLETGIGGISIEAVRERVLQAFAASHLAEAKIYFHATRGSGPRDHAGGDGLEPNFFLTISELPASGTDAPAGICVSTYPDLRWKRCDIKSLNLLPNVLARRDAASKGCEEAVLVNESGVITEGAASAVFAVEKNTIRTAPLSANILPSVTRRYVLKAANSLGMDILEKSMTPAEAAGADELFIAVTTRDIVPVTALDGRRIGAGACGDLTAKLSREFKGFV